MNFIFVIRLNILFNKFICIMIINLFTKFSPLTKITNKQFFAILFNLLLYFNTFVLVSYVIWLNKL
jgi:hypothetical protein